MRGVRRRSTAETLVAPTTFARGNVVEPTLLRAADSPYRRLMGTWGPGNFDSDTAADHVSMLASKLVTDIETAMNGDAVALEPDEWDGTTVPCNVELLTLIAKQGWVGVTLPAPDIVAGWGTKFVGIWAASIDGLDPSPQWKARRRDVLVRTFAELEALCARERSAVKNPRPTRAKKRAAKKAPTRKGGRRK